MNEAAQFEVLEQCFHAWQRDASLSLTDEDYFAHYTSASAAMSIIRSTEPHKRCLWLRNARLMNDFAEIDYGRSILVDAFREVADSFRAVCDAIHPDIKSVLDEIDREAAIMKDNVYLLSLSRHRGKECYQGKLSMWRAYGGEANVCLLLNPLAFVTPQDAYDVDLAPVYYDGMPGVREELFRMISVMSLHQTHLRQINPQDVKDHIRQAFEAIVLSSKHPGFFEEHEWRVVLKRRYWPEANTTPSQLVDLNGIQQEVFYLPMLDIPGKGVLNAELPQLLERLIIGPTPNPLVVQLAFVRALSEAGVGDTTARIAMCGIPLRR